MNLKIETHSMAEGDKEQLPVTLRYGLDVLLFI